MRNKIIKPYDETDSFYSGSDEEYEEFLKSIDGKINAGEPVEDKQMDDLGETKTINLQGVIDKFRKTAEGIKDVSKKFTSEAVNKIEDIKKPADEHTDSPLAEDNDEIVLDVDEIKKQISEAVKKSMADFNTNPEYSAQEIEDIAGGINKLNDLIKDVEVNVRDNASSAENVRLKTETISSGVEEIRQAVSSISKLNDSIFDLKNAQLNSKNSLEALEVNFNNLKKKCVIGITVISILILISIGMSVLVLLS